MNGYGERCGNAKTSILDHPGPLGAEARNESIGPRTPQKRLTLERPHLVDELLQCGTTENRTSPYVGAKTPSPTRGGMHVAGVNKKPPTRRTFEHIGPRRRGRGTRRVPMV